MPLLPSSKMFDKFLISVLIPTQTYSLENVKLILALKHDCHAYMQETFTRESGVPIPAQLCIFVCEGMVLIRAQRFVAIYASICGKHGEAH